MHRKELLRKLSASAGDLNLKVEVRLPMSAQQAPNLKVEVRLPMYAQHHPSPRRRGRCNARRLNHISAMSEAKTTRQLNPTHDSKNMNPTLVLQ